MSSSPGEAVAHNVRDDSDDAWIERLTSEWQIIADLSFADLALWKPEGETFRAIAQCRPSTGPTLHPDVIVVCESRFCNKCPALCFSLYQLLTNACCPQGSMHQGYWRPLRKTHSIEILHASIW